MENNNLCNIDKTVVLIGNCKIGKNTKILPYTVLDNATIGENCQIGPYAHIHGNSIIGNGCRIGNYVEINRSILENEVKVAHLSYIGDATISYHTNIGAGVVICNYDGLNKHKTQIGNHCFIGSNCSIIAPRVIKDRCYVASGSVVDCDLGETTFLIARPEKKIKTNIKIY